MSCIFLNSCEIFVEIFSWDIYVRYFCKTIRAQPCLLSVYQWPARRKEDKVVMYFTKFSWDIIVKFSHDIFTRDNFVKFCYEISMWDIFVKKLGHNPGSIHLASGLQSEKNKMLLCIFLNFREIFCEILSWDIYVRYLCEIFLSKS